MINNHGKKSTEWLKVRKAWVQANPPSHEGQYVCGICGKAVHIDDMELDHIIPRSNHSVSFTELSNLQPSHGICNRRKGSRHLKPVISQAEYRLRKQLNL